MIRSIALLISIVCLAVPAIAPAADSTRGEQAAVEMLGLKEHQTDLFTPKGLAIVAMTSDAAIKVTKYYEPNTQKFIAYSWVPQGSSISKMSKKKVIAKCGKPDEEKSDYIGYGKVFLSFGKDGHLSQVTIHIKK